MTLVDNEPMGSQRLVPLSNFVALFRLVSVRTIPLFASAFAARRICRENRRRRNGSELDSRTRKVNRHDQDSAAGRRLLIVGLRVCPFGVRGPRSLAIHSDKQG